MRGGTCGGLASTATKLVSAAPCSSRFNSCSLPRLRSQPIHRRWCPFHWRRRCRSRKRSSPSTGPCTRFRRAMPAAAAPRSPASDGWVSASASAQSDSSAYHTSPPCVARWCTSRFCSASSMSPRSASSVGITIMVRSSAGTPSSSSSPGSVVAPHRRVMQRFTTATADSEAASSASTSTAAAAAGSICAAPASANAAATRAAVSTPIPAR